ncbi:SMI1/KNR4 family protein [Aquibacillus rhizosphaerae]|uniref:SMI1/KNR4 family protein n=1 Tax=Aquibacillus rhizosphaerae TaxID=3051431 RepID=A0ABT7L9S4_9BACI|nr:SMI1/KNR4 family protein [Aquibacillus sp. LR5S19]MDL4842134.1 SMI1/KNR4 family protein [Aquibacillus sp. LR5S19]
MNTIETLKKRINQNKLVVQKEDGYLAEEVFNFNPPALKEDLDKLPSYVPADLISLLSKNNGAYLFEHPVNGGGTQLFSIDEIIEYRDIWDCPEYFIPIGIGMDGLWIVCQYDKETKENYMWIGEFLNFEDDFEKLSIDFSTWLERFIICQGCSFWEWNR